MGESCVIREGKKNDGGGAEGAVLSGPGKRGLHRLLLFSLF